MEINKKLKSKTNLLLALGAERDTPEKQSLYLLDIFTAFQELTAQALAARYSNDLFDECLELRLATLLWNRNDEFKEDMARYGHKYSFASADGSGNKESGISAKNGLNGEKDTKSGVVSPRKEDNLAELEGVLHDQESLQPPSDEDILEWIENLYRASRGFEIGTFNPMLMSTIMRKQSVKWTDIALGYISDVIALIHNFIVCVLARVCPDERVCGNLMSVLMDDLIKRYKDAVGQVKFLLHVERTGTLMTLNDNLQRTIESKHIKR